MPLLNDIQAATFSQTTDIPTLLRMCKLLAARISHVELAEWVSFELDGYPDIASMPDYRIVQVDSYGSFLGPVSSMGPLQIPVSVLPEELRKQYRNAYLGSGVSAYAALLLNDETGRVEDPWPVTLANQYASTMTPNMQCLAAWKVIPIGAVVRLLDSVKTRVLNFAIDLERAAPNSGELPVGSQPPLSRELMTQIFNTNITGGVNNIANASSEFTQQANTVIETGNWASLQKRLLEFGISADEIGGLKEDLDQAITENNQDVKRSVAGSWIGRLSTKAATGAAGVGIEVAAAGVAKAIAFYLGL